jgi:hypothetical protein
MTLDANDGFADARAKGVRAAIKASIRKNLIRPYLFAAESPQKPPELHANILGGNRFNFFDPARVQDKNVHINGIANMISLLSATPGFNRVSMVTTIIRAVLTASQRVKAVKTAEKFSFELLTPG